MKRTRFIALLLTLQCTAAFAQTNYSFQPNKVTQYEMDLTEHPDFPNAEAVVIYEYGDFYMRGEERAGGFVLKKKTQLKIKILKEAGLEYADFEIPLYNNSENSEELEITSAVVYNAENGKLHTDGLDLKKVFTEKINANWTNKKFTMPGVRAGSIIELEYTISTPFFFNMGDWNFQKEIPVIYSQLRYRAIPYYEYTYILRGTNKFDEFRSNVLNDEVRFGRLLYKEVEYVFGMRDIAPFEDEEFISSPKDYMLALNFQLSKIHYPTGGTREIMSTWPALCDAFLKEPEFGKYIDASAKAGKKLLPTLQLANLSPEEQMKSIVQYMKTNYNWNGRYGKYANEKLSDFIKNKKGNVANLNLYLIGLLQAAGLDVTPVILSTRSNGAISPLHTFESFFNYVAAMVSIGDKTYCLDCTEPMLYYDELPSRCINVHGLLVKPKSEEWVKINQEKRAVTEKQFDIKLKDGGHQLDVNARYVASGNDAYHYRKVYLGEKSNLSDYFKENDNIDITGDIEVENHQQLDQPFVFSFAFVANAEEAPGKLFIAPFCKLVMADNPFKQNTRTLPVDMIHLHVGKYSSRITIPNGYRVEFLPEEAKFSNKMMTFSYKTNMADPGIIEIETEYALNKAVYTAQEYPVLRNLMSLAINKFAEMVVLAKE